MDCALAELYTKSLATERILQEQKHVEVLTKLYVRMNEVTETLRRCCGVMSSFVLTQSMMLRDRSYV